MHRLASLALFPALTVPALVMTAQQAESPSSAQWLDIQLKARSVLVDATEPTALHEVMDPLPDPLGQRSHDGSRVAYIASDPQRVKDGHDFDLFVADVDATQPSGKANIRRLTTDQVRPTDAQWAIDGSGLVFLAGEPSATQVWWIDLGAESRPVMLSEGKHRCSSLSVLADGRVAWVVHTGSKNKQQFNDLIVHSSPSVSGRARTLLAGEHISAYAFSPDGRTLAWGEPASLHLLSLESGSSREIPLHGVHRQLINHMAHDLAWSPDSRIVAGVFGFAGGVSRGLNDDPGQPWPRMFAEDKVFFIPAQWTPAPKDLQVGEGADFPSPFATDEQAEVSPPPGDQSKPWWVRGLPMRANGLKWIDADTAKARMNKPN
jgi:dipeptidyl aminopeptidase/acylaminoacyl peptidase